MDRAPTHKAHDLLAALMDRAHDWRFRPVLERSKENPSKAGPPPEAKEALERLAAANARMGPYPGTLPKSAVEAGPLWLRLGDHAVEVADHLSIWGAIQSAPARLKPLDGADRAAWVNLMMDVVNSANRHWSAVKSLGLSPRDELRAEAESDDPLSPLGANRALQLIRLKNLAIDIARQAGRADPTEDDYRSSWDAKAPFRRVTFQDFAESSVGRTIMNDQNPIRVAEVDDDRQEDVDGEEAMDLTEFMLIIERCVRDQVISPLMGKAMISVSRGLELSDIYEAIPALFDAYQTYDLFKSAFKAAVEALAHHMRDDDEE